MTLNLLQLSRAFNVFVASQFRVGVRHSVDGIHGRYHKPLYPLDLRGNLAFIPPGTRYAAGRHSVTAFPPVSRNFNTMLLNPQMLLDPRTLLPNPHRGQVRFTHTGNKSSPCTEFSPIVGKTNKNNLPQGTRSPVDCAGNKSFCKDKVKICRPRVVSSSATNLHADFKMQKMLKLLKDQKYRADLSRNKRVEGPEWFGDCERKIGIGQSKETNIKTGHLMIQQNLNDTGCKIQPNKTSQLVKSKAKTQSKSVDGVSVRGNMQNDDLLLSIANVARDIMEWLDTVRKNPAKIQQAEYVFKKAANVKTSRRSDGQTAHNKLSKKVAICQPSLNLPLTKSQPAAETSVNTTQGLLGGNKVGKNITTSSGLAKDLDQINQDITRLKRERNATKDSKRPPRNKPSDKPKETEELLEIRPTYIENIEQHIEPGISKKTESTNFTNSQSTLQVAPVMSKTKSEMKTGDSETNKSFNEMDKSRSQTVENRSPPQLESTTINSEKGFVLVNTEPVDGKAMNSIIAKPAEKESVVVNTCEDSANLVRKSKEANFILINDNLSHVQSESGKSTGAYNTAEVVVHTDDVTGVTNQDTNLQFKGVNQGMIGCMPFCGIREKPGSQQTTENSQTQRIGSSDSSDELSRPLNKSSMREAYDHLAVTRVPNGGEVDTVGVGREGLQKRSMFLKEELRYKSAFNPETLYESKGRKNCTSGTDNQVADCNNGNTADVQSTWGVSDATASEDVIETHIKRQLDSTLGIKSAEARSTKLVTPSADVIKTEQSNILTDGAQIGPKEHQDSYGPKQCHVLALDREDAKRSTLTALKSPAKVTELKPDLNESRRDKPSQLKGECAKKCKSEPKLCVKPEELSKTFKFKHSGKSMKSRSQTPPRNCANTSSIVTSGVGLNSLKPEIVRITNRKSQQTAHTTERKEANADTFEKSVIGNNGKPSLDDKDISSKPTKGVPLSELFSQMQQNKKTSPRNTNIATRQSSSKDTTYTKKALMNKELIRTLQEKWSKEFQEKYHKLQQSNIYSPYIQSNTNCLVSTSQDCNSSSDDKQDITDIQSTPTIQTTSPSSTNDLLPKKIDMFPKMGMAQRLLTASRKSQDSKESVIAKPEVTFSDTTMTSEAPGTQGTTEVEELPEIDQFEEWIQNNMPEIYKDSKSNTSLGKNREVPSKSDSADNLRLPSMDTPRTPSACEGSDVDGPFPPASADKLSNQEIYARAARSEMSTQNIPSCQGSAIDEFPDKCMRDTCIGTGVTTLSKDSYRFNSRSATGPANRHESFNKTNKYRKSLINSQQQSETDILLTKDQPDSKSVKNKDNVLSALDISNKANELPTLDISNTQKNKTASTLSYLSSVINPNLLGSMDGLVTMNLVSGSQPSNLKPTLKKSTSRERSAERAVSFSNKTSTNDNNRADPVIGAASEKVSESFGTSVDHFPLEGDFVGDKIHQDRDLRQDLAEKRKRSEMEARIKLINDHTRQIRENEAVLFKYRDLIGKIKADVRGLGGDKTAHPQTQREV